MNALGGDTYVFAEIDGQYSVFTLKELYELHKQGCKIKVPTLLNERGDKGWVEVEDVVSYGNQSFKRITLSSSRLYVEISEDAIIPAFSHHLFETEKEKIMLNFSIVNNLKAEKPLYFNSSLLLSTRIPLNIPDGDQKDYDYGFALGFFISEGNFVKRKHKNTKRSMEVLKGFARNKGMSLQQYLSYITDVKEIVLTVGAFDFERGNIKILQKYFKFSKPYKYKNSNTYKIYSHDLNLIRLIIEHVEGHTSHDKHIKNTVYNHSIKFLEGLLQGVLNGDGWYMKKSNCFGIKITTNFRLYNDLIFLSKGLGYDVHLWKAIYAKGGFAWSDKFYWSLQLGIFKTYHRRTALGLVREHIKSIEDVGEKEAFNLVVKPLYPENDKRAKFNHLYFTAYGFLVSDAVKTLDRGSLSFSLPVPVSERVDSLF